MELGDPVPVWADGRIICCGWCFNPIIASGSQEADSLYSCWPVSWWAGPESVCQNPTPTPPLLENQQDASSTRPTVLIYGRLQRQRAESKSISHFSKRPLKDDYSIPPPVQNNPRCFNVISVGPHTPAAWLKIFLHLFNQTSPAHSVQFSCKRQRRRASPQSIKKIHQCEEERAGNQLSFLPWKQIYCYCVAKIPTVHIKVTLRQTLWAFTAFCFIFSNSSYQTGNTRSFLC